MTNTLNNSAFVFFLLAMGLVYVYLLVEDKFFKAVALGLLIGNVAGFLASSFMARQEESPWAQVQTTLKVSSVKMFIHEDSVQSMAQSLQKYCKKSPGGSKQVNVRLLELAEDLKNIYVGDEQQPALKHRAVIDAFAFCATSGK